MKNEKIKRLLTLFFSVFKLSACTFGGGFVIVPLMKKKFVDDLGWIDEDEMLDYVSIAQSSPGPIAVNGAIILGYKISGVIGAIVAVLGSIIPPLIIISVISMFYEAFRSNVVVNLVMKGMTCGVAAVILDVVIKMTVDIFKKKRILPVLVLVGAFAAKIWLNVNIIVIILVCAVIGGIDTLIQTKKAKEGDVK